MTIRPLSSTLRRGCGLLAVLLLAACRTAPGAGPLERHEFTRVQMGVASRVVLYARDAREARDAAAAAFERIAALERVMSDYQPDSEVSRLTVHPRGESFAMSEDLCTVLAASEEVSLATGGAFDVTIGPVVKLWREARRSGVAPDEAALAGAWERVGFTDLMIDRATRRVTLTGTGMEIDLGAIGKGYAAQQAVDLMKERGFTRCLVALAGDIAVGESPLDARTGRPTDGWRIDVRTGVESGEGTEGARTLLLSNAAVSTSGDSEQFFEIDGMRYAHIIDGRLARRASALTLADQAFGYRRGVTVVSDRGDWADALGTALAIVGPEWLTREGGEARVRSLLKRFGNGWALIEWESAGVVRSMEVGARRVEVRREED